MMINADARHIPLVDDSVQCCVTSPPYYKLRDYGNDKQIGIEDTAQSYVEEMTRVFREVRRVLTDTGTLWLNLGDSYNKNQLSGIPWRVAFALQADGWYLRQDIIWSKPNPMPESVNNRCAKSHEYIFLLTKSPKYVFNAAAIAQPITDVSRRRYEAVIRRNEQFDPKKHKHTTGVQSPMEILTRTAQKSLDTGTRKERSVWNGRGVWTIPTGGNAAAGHFATFPQALPDKCILAGSDEGDIVLDPFSGSGTTGIAAKWRRRKYIGLELNPDYVKLSVDRLSATPDAEPTLPFSEDANDK